MLKDLRVAVLPSHLLPERDCRELEDGPTLGPSRNPARTPALSLTRAMLVDACVVSRAMVAAACCTEATGAGSEPVERLAGAAGGARP